MILCRTYIPWFKVADEEASKKITVNHLLHHISGLSEAGFTVVLPDNASNEEAVRTLSSAELTAAYWNNVSIFQRRLRCTGSCPAKRKRDEV